MLSPSHEFQFSIQEITRRKKAKTINPEEDLGTTFFKTLNKETDDRKTPTRLQIIEEQKIDPELAKLREDAVTEEEAEQFSTCYYLQNDMLMRKWRPPDAAVDEEWRIVQQIVVPAPFRNYIMNLAHSSPLSGHLGIHKTYHRIISHFYWPKIKADVTQLLQFLPYMPSSRETKSKDPSSTS